MKLDESINNIRTMQKSYDTLADGIAITAKEDTLLQESESIKQAIANEVAQQSTLEEVKNAVENIDFTPIEEKIDNIDLSSIKGENPEATNSNIYEKLQKQLLYNEETGCLTITNANINIE